MRMCAVRTACVFILVCQQRKVKIILYLLLMSNLHASPLHKRTQIRATSNNLLLLLLLLPSILMMCHVESAMRLEFNSITTTEQRVQDRPFHHIYFFRASYKMD